MIISKRHKRSALKTKVVRRIAAIPADEWNKVFPNVIEGYDFYRTLDDSNLKQFSLYYIMVYDRKTPVGATTCFLTDYSLDTSINGPLRRITDSIRKIKPNIFSIRALVCGMPLGQGRIGVAPGRDDTVIKAALLRRMEQIAKKNRAAVVAFKDFNRSYAKMLDPLRKSGFTRFDSLPSTELDVSFKDFEDYLKTLSGANRYDLRRKFKKVDKAVKINMDIVESLEEATLNDVYRLYLDIVNKHEMTFELVPIDFFRNISRNMPNRTKFFLWRIEGKLVAFLFCMVSDGLFMDYYLGLDYSVAHEYHLYFIKFRDVLNWCIKNGIKKYDMGTTCYEPKKRLGFDIEPLYLYVKLRNRMFRPVFSLVGQFLKFENFDPALKQIKKAKKT